VQVGTGEENSLSSGIWRKYPLRDLHWVAEHPERLNKRFLEKETRKALYSPSMGEERQNPLGV
jgi:hypothetical protein